MNDNEKFPELVIRDGSSGLAIAAIPGESFNCVEFTLKSDYPQDILIAPWIQFESVQQAEWRSRWAYEISRRAKLHDELIKQIADLQAQRIGLYERLDEAIAKTNETVEMWRKERISYGLKEDFSDYATTEATNKT
jgi:hypothetical protein